MVYNNTKKITKKNNIYFTNGKGMFFYKILQSKNVIIYQIFNTFLICIALQIEWNNWQYKNQNINLNIMGIHGRHCQTINCLLIVFVSHKYQILAICSTLCFNFCLFVFNRLLHNQNKNALYHNKSPHDTYLFLRIFEWDFCQLPLKNSQK